MPTRKKTQQTPQPLQPKLEKKPLGDIELPPVKQTPPTPPVKPPRQ